MQHCEYMLDDDAHFSDHSSKSITLLVMRMALLQYHCASGEPMNYIAHLHP